MGFPDAGAGPIRGFTGSLQVMFCYVNIVYFLHCGK